MVGGFYSLPYAVVVWHHVCLHLGLKISQLRRFKEPFPLCSEATSRGMVTLLPSHSSTLLWFLFTISQNHWPVCFSWWSEWRMCCPGSEAMHAAVRPSPWPLVSISRRHRWHRGCRGRARPVMTLGRGRKWRLGRRRAPAGSLLAGPGNGQRFPALPAAALAARSRLGGLLLELCSDFVPPALPAR